MDTLPLALLALSACLAGCGGAPPEPAAPPPPPAPQTVGASATQTDDDAHLDVESRAPAEVRLDGKTIGKTPLVHYKVTPGRHDVTFVFGPDNTQTLTVNVGPGKTATVRLDQMPPSKEH